MNSIIPNIFEMMSSIVDENVCFLCCVQSNQLKLLKIKEKVALSDDLFKMVSAEGSPPYFVRMLYFMGFSHALSFHVSHFVSHFLLYRDAFELYTSICRSQKIFRSILEPMNIKSSTFTHPSKPELTLPENLIAFYVIILYHENIN